MAGSADELIEQLEAFLEDGDVAAAEARLDELLSMVDRGLGGVAIAARVMWLDAVIWLERGAAGAFLDRSARAISLLDREGEGAAAATLSVARAELGYGLATEMLVDAHGLAGFLEACRLDCELLVDMFDRPRDPRWALVDRYRIEMLPRLVSSHGSAGQPPPIARVIRTFGLEAIENVLLIQGATLAMHRRLRRALPPPPVSIDADAVDAGVLATLCFANPTMRQAALDALHPDGRLARHRLLATANLEPLCVQATAGLCAFLRGGFAPPPQAEGAVTLVDAAPPRDLAAEDEVAVSRLAAALGGDDPATVVVSGESARARIEAALARAGRPALRIDLSVLPGGAVAEVAARVARDAALRNAPVWTAGGDPPDAIAAIEADLIAEGGVSVPGRPDPLALR